MTTIEDRLRDLGRTVTPPPLPGATAVMQRGRQRRHRRRGGLAAAVVIAGTGAGIAGRALRPDDEPTVRIGPGSPADDGSGEWEEIPVSPPDDGADDGSGEWEEIPVSPPDSGSGQWDEAPATGESTSPTWSAPTTIEPGYVIVPDVVGLTVAEGRRIMEDLGFLVQVVGNGDDDARIVTQDPAPAIAASVGATVRLEGR